MTFWCIGRELQQQVAQLQSEYTRVGDQLESEQTRIMQVRHLQAASKGSTPEEAHPAQVRAFVHKPSAWHAIGFSTGDASMVSNCRSRMMPR